MEIGPQTVATIDYSLTDETGNVIESTEGNSPLAYLHGVGMIIPGLEQGLAGKQSGDDVALAIAPKDGYGDRDERLLQKVPRSEFAGIDDLAIGMQFRVPADNGEELIVTIAEIDDEMVTVDGNHPLAGVTLHFEIQVRSVRTATDQEVAHGHAHGDEGHDH